jgi:putative FmdB family regulatory protein
MPIYAYKCGSCGHAKDVLQKISDDPLTVCPACGAPTFSKQVTAAGFQLKGSGWYATDFKGGASAPAADKPAEKSADKPADVGPAKTDAPSTPAKSDAPSASAGGCGASCACH